MQRNTQSCRGGVEKSSCTERSSFNFITLRLHLFVHIIRVGGRPSYTVYAILVNF